VAASLLASNPHIADCIISHRLPLEAAAEAFAIAVSQLLGSATGLPLRLPVYA
jgi:hypothetical protein